MDGKDCQESKMRRESDYYTNRLRQCVYMQLKQKVCLIFFIKPVTDVENIIVIDGNITRSPPSHKLCDKQALL